MHQKENLHSSNHFRIAPDRSKKSILRTSKELPSIKSIKDTSMKAITQPDIPPCQKYLFGTTPSIEQMRKFVTLFYQGLLYSVCSLKGPSEDYLRKKSVRLPEPKESKKKFLMLDLDQTLIHTVWGQEKSDFSVQKGEQTIRFNVRPYCLSFLERMSGLFEIYVFTASTEEYAQAIVGHLNAKKKTIQGILNRNHCMETHHGLRIKDLRIIKNRPLSQIVIVDNLVHSFGLQLDNGIPILDFTHNKKDRELLGLEKLLMEVNYAEDVRDFLRNRVALRKCLEISQEEFWGISRKKGCKKA